MKAKTTLRRVLTLSLLVLIVLLLSACAVQASADAQTPPIVDRFLDFVVDLGALVPVVAVGAPVISLIVDLAKRLNMNSKYSPALSAALNLTLYTVAYMLGPERQAQFTTAMTALYAVLPYVFALFVTLITTVAWHNKLAAAGIGYSKTPRKA